MTTPSTNSPNQLSTSPETPCDHPLFPATAPARDDDERKRIVLSDNAEPTNVGDELVILPETEDEFRQAAEQAVRDRFARLRRLGQLALVEAIALADLLARTKERLGHGNWLPFLRAIGINERTAQNYLLIHRYQQPLCAEYENNSALTLTGALHLARRLNKAPNGEATREPATAESTQETVSVDTVDPLPAVGVVRASLDAASIESRLVVTRTIPPMRDYSNEDRAAFEEAFRVLTGTLHRAATEGIAGHVLRDEVLFDLVEATHKFLTRRRKEAGT